MRGGPAGPVESRVAVWTATRTAVAVVASALFLAPAVWLVVSSIRPSGDILGHLYPLTPQFLFPREVTLRNYANLLAGGFGRAAANSLYVSVVTVVLGLLLSALAAYALAVLRFRGREAVFAIVVVCFMIPFEAIAIPLSVTFQTWGLTDSYTALILPGLANGLAIFNLRQFFLGIPIELREAAVLDGAGELRILFRVYLPLCRPALIGSGIMLFLGQWSSYVWPLLVVTDPDKQVAPIALSKAVTEYQVDYGQQFAGAMVLALVPALILLLLQRQFIRSLAATGVRG